MGLERKGAWPSGVVALSMGLAKVRSEQGIAACEKQLQAVCGELPICWLQMHHFTLRMPKPRRLREPVKGDLHLPIYLSSNPTESLPTGESMTSTIKAFKSRLCQELGLDLQRVRMWYFITSPISTFPKKVSLLENQPDWLLRDWDLDHDDKI